MTPRMKVPRVPVKPPEKYKWNDEKNYDYLVDKWNIVNSKFMMLENSFKHGASPSALAVMFDSIKDATASYCGLCRDFWKIQDPLPLPPGLAVDLPCDGCPAAEQNVCRQSLTIASITKARNKPVFWRLHMALTNRDFKNTKKNIVAINKFIEQLKPEK